MAKRDDVPVQNPLDAKLADELTQVRTATVEMERPPAAERLTRIKKTGFTDSEQLENDEVLRRLSEVVGVYALPWACVDRALWAALRKAAPGISDDAPKLSRPPNGDRTGQAELEEQLTTYLVKLIKKASE